MIKIATRATQTPIPIFASEERPVLEAVSRGVCEESVAYGPAAEEDWRRVVVLGWASSVEVVAVLVDVVEIEVSGDE